VRKSLIVHIVKYIGDSQLPIEVQYPELSNEVRWLIHNRIIKDGADEES